MPRDSAEYAEMVAEVFVETVRKAATKAMCCEYDSEEITPSLMESLQYVYIHGPSPIREIASGMEVSVSATSQQVEKLVKKGLVTRSENESDRRLSRIELTVAGREVVRQMRERRSGWFGSIVNAMPEAKRKAFLEGLESFLRLSLADEESLDRACVRCGMEHVAYCVVSKVKNERKHHIEG
ncbi:MAG: MarR family transcriptional regulator [Armatimonadetes bacterium]|nr:MarR family transcriptional regulator [Armatimonadota bacterium]